MAACTLYDRHEAKTVVLTPFSIDGPLMSDPSESPLMATVETCLNPAKSQGRHKKDACAIADLFQRLYNATAPYNDNLASSAMMKMKHNVVNKIDFNDGSVDLICNGEECDYFCNKFEGNSQGRGRSTVAVGRGRLQRAKCGGNKKPTPPGQMNKPKITSSSNTREDIARIEREVKEHFKSMDMKLRKYLKLNKTGDGEMNSSMAIAVSSVTSKNSFPTLSLDATTNGTGTGRQRRVCLKKLKLY